MILLKRYISTVIQDFLKSPAESEIPKSSSASRMRDMVWNMTIPIVHVFMAMVGIVTTIGNTKIRWVMAVMVVMVAPMVMASVMVSTVVVKVKVVRVVVGYVVRLMIPVTVSLCVESTIVKVVETKPTASLRFIVVVLEVSHIEVASVRRRLKPMLFNRRAAIEMMVDVESTVKSCLFVVIIIYYNVRSKVVMRNKSSAPLAVNVLKEVGQGIGHGGRQ